MVMNIHITRNGEQHGPYPEESARQMLEAGQLLPADLAWHEGADGWKPLSEVLGAAAVPPAQPPGGEIPGHPVAETAPAVEAPEDIEPDDLDKIHVTRNGNPIGPYPRDAAKEYFAAGQLLSTDWGWHDGMDEWKPLNEVLSAGESANTGGAPTPVTADPMAAANPAVAAVEAAVVSAENQGAKKKKILIMAGSTVGVLVIAGVLCFVYPGFLKNGKGEDANGLSEAKQTVVGTWDRIEDPNSEANDNDSVGDFEFRANGDLLANPGTMIEARYKWELQNQEIVVTHPENITPPRYFKIDSKGILTLTKVLVDGKPTSMPNSPDTWRKVK
jgi:hypothetical protein